MTRSKTSLHLIAKATAAVIALGMSVAPAQAGNLTWSFSFGTPNVHVSSGQGPVIVHAAPPVQVSRCMTNRQIINSMNDHGYRNVQFQHERDYGKPMFSYWSRGWTHKAKIDRCSGHLIPVSNAPAHPRPSHGGGHGHQGAVIYKIN